MSTSAKVFRDSFKISKEILKWYPGHMYSSYKHMQAKMRKTDCIIEVHDARIPISGRNPLFLKSLAGSKPHILVLNKRDLISKENEEKIKFKFLEENWNLVFTNCLDQNDKGVSKLISLAVSLMKGSIPQPRDTLHHTVMVVGVPNVGKSSIINALRHKILAKGKGTKVGPQPGVTKSVLAEIKISENPLIYLIDTPGILLPNVNNVETGMKLALCSCIKDEIVGPTFIADFLLYWMNKTRNFNYVDYFKIKEPIDDIFPILVKIAVDNNKMIKMKSVSNNKIEILPDIHASANIMISLFRKNTFGDLSLDSHLL